MTMPSRSPHFRNAVSRSDTRLSPLLGKSAALRIGGAALLPTGRYFPTPIYGTCCRPFTDSGTTRPAAFAISSVLSTTGMMTPIALLRNQPNCLGARDELQSALHHGRVDHLRAEAHHSQALFLRFVIRGNDSLRALDFCRRGRESFMDHGNLHRMHASHAFKSQCPGIQAPALQALHVAHISEYRVDRLHSGGPRSIHHPLPRIQ